MRHRTALVVWALPVVQGRRTTEEPRLSHLGCLQWVSLHRSLQRGAGLDLSLPWAALLRWASSTGRSHPLDSTPGSGGSRWRATRANHPDQVECCQRRLEWLRANLVKDERHPEWLFICFEHPRAAYPPFGQFCDQSDSHMWLLAIQLTFKHVLIELFDRAFFERPFSVRSNLLMAYKIQKWR